MKSILDISVQSEILKRIQKLSPESKPLWGKMSTDELVCHLADQMKVALGYIKLSYQGNFFTKNILKNLILRGLQAPKGKIKTHPELDQSLGKGTKAVEFNKDKNSLILLIQEFIEKNENFDFGEHEMFGKLTKQEWGKFSYFHLNHHLKQFGV